MIDWNRVRDTFGPLNQGQVDGINLLLREAAVLPKTHRAYVLATAWHETDRTMQPVRETLAASDGQAIARLETAWQKGQLSWVSQPYWRRDADGKSWYGRGYVQLTHKANYQRAQDRMGIDLTSDPNRVLDPEIAAAIIVLGMSEGWFTGKRMYQYLPGDYEGARRVVNGTDRASTIAGYARAFEAALPDISPAPVTPQATGLWGAILAFIRAILTGGKA